MCYRKIRKIILLPYEQPKSFNYIVKTALLLTGSEKLSNYEKNIKQKYDIDKKTRSYQFTKMIILSSYHSIPYNVPSHLDKYASFMKILK